MNEMKNLTSFNNPPLTPFAKIDKVNRTKSSKGGGELNIKKQKKNEFFICRYKYLYLVF